MPFPELVWTAAGIIGGLLLIDNLNLTTRGKVGVWLIFAGFVFQTYWAITNPWSSENSLILVIFVSVIIVVGLGVMWVKRRGKKTAD